MGRRELAAEFADEEDETVRKAMIEAQVFLTYRRDLNNLSIQEARLRRRYEKDEAELKRRIAEREQVAKNRDAEEHRRWQHAIQNYRAAKLLEMPFDPAEIGFEFSIEEIAAREQQQLLKGAIDQGRYYEFKKKGWLQLPDKAAWQFLLVDPMQSIFSALRRGSAGVCGMVNAAAVASLACSASFAVMQMRGDQ